VEGLGPGQDELDRPAEPPGGQCERADMRLEGVLLPEGAAGVRRNHLDVVGIKAELGGQSSPDGAGVLRALMHDQGVAAPFDHAGDQLHRYLMLIRVLVYLVDLDRAVGERGVGVADRDVGEEGQRYRLGLHQRLCAVGVQVRRERLCPIAGPDAPGRLRDCQQRVRYHQRDRLAPVGDAVIQQRLQALKAVATGHDEPW
jgi:hypothetical protein